jgi:aspartate aminotransferase
LQTTIQSPEGSRTAAIFQRAVDLANQGQDIINLAVGDPVFETPEAVIAAVKMALEDGQTRYSAVAGLPALRNQIAQCLTTPAYQADNIIVCNGAKQALYIVLRALCQAGDEVIIPTPCWVSFVHQVKLAGAQPVLVKTKRFHLDFDRLTSALNNKTKAIVINSPNNPSGAVYSRADLSRLAQWAAAHELFIISDETYDHFIFDGHPYTSMMAFPEIKQQTIIVGSFSKTYSMTGFRIGYAVAPSTIIEAMTRWQSHLSGNVCTFGQYGALKALALKDAFLTQRLKALGQKRDLALGKVLNWSVCMTPQGAFYLFPDVSGSLHAGEGTEQLAIRLLEEAGVAVVPGEAFAVPGHIRISFAVEDEVLVEGLDRIAGVL